MRLARGPSFVERVDTGPFRFACKSASLAKTMPVIGFRIRSRHLFFEYRPPVTAITSRPATAAYRRRCDPEQFPDRN